MYKIERKKYGFHLTFANFIKKSEMGKWLEESKVKLADSLDEFGVFVEYEDIKTPAAR